MRYSTFISGLDEKRLQAYAERAGTTVAYIKSHIRPDPPGRTPRPDLMLRLWEATEGEVEWHEVLGHFYRNPKANAA